MILYNNQLLEVVIHTTFTLNIIFRLGSARASKGLRGGDMSQLGQGSPWEVAVCLVLSGSEKNAAIEHMMTPQCQLPGVTMQNYNTIRSTGNYFSVSHMRRLQVIQYIAILLQHSTYLQRTPQGILGVFMKIDRRNETYKEVTYMHCIYNHSKPWEFNYCIWVDDVPGSHMEHAGREFGSPKKLPPPPSS